GQRTNPKWADSISELWKSEILIVFLESIPVSILCGDGTPMEKNGQDIYALWTFPIYKKHFINGAQFSAR
ncbi:12170_t:CDS:1, partial [Gigaspora margarita]